MEPFRGFLEKGKEGDGARGGVRVCVLLLKVHRRKMTLLGRGVEEAGPGADGLRQFFL